VVQSGCRIRGKPAITRRLPPAPSAAPTSEAPAPIASTTTAAAPPPAGGGATSVIADTTVADNTALLTATGFGSFAEHWLPVLGRCNTYAPSTPYEISSGVQVNVWCPWRGPAPDLVINLRRFATAAQAKTYMICQQPAGTPPPDVNESIVDLPGTNLVHLRLIEGCDCPDRTS
jgi:hypothetical protein